MVDLSNRTLTAGDQRVLDTLLGQGGTGKVQAIDSQLPPDQNVSREIALELSKLEEKAVTLADKGKFIEAEDILCGIIQTYPQYASAYNNRAQLHRLAGHTNEIAVVDIKRCILLASPATKEEPISDMQASVLRNAYSQLAAIYLDMSKAEHTNQNDAWNLQQAASEALAKAGQYGDQVAGAVASSLNPYAKLCGTIVQEAMMWEQCPEN